MKINRLRLKNFIGISKGLGLEEIELDLSGLNGLIALSGKNGAGKTSILESLHPYRTLASRKKALSYHVNSNACKELDFDFQGDSYRTKILINADSGRQEGFIWKNGQSMVDGKARSYDDYITDLFGSKNLFFNSIFCAQNAQKMSDLTTGKLKELFSEFLQLHKYIAYESTVKQCLGVLAAQAAAYDRQAESIQERIQLLAGCGAHHKEAQKRQADKQVTLKNIEIEIKGIESDIVTAKEKLAANTALEDRAADFRQRISEAEKAVEDEKNAYNDRVSGLRRGLMECNDDIASYSNILDLRVEIEAARTNKIDMEAEINMKGQELQRGQDALIDVKNRIHALNQTSLTLAQPHEKEGEIPILQERIRNAENKAAELEKRDDTCVSEVCSFIVGAIKAGKSLPALNDELSTLQKDVASHNQHVKKALEKAAAEKEILVQKQADITNDAKRIKTLIDQLKTDHAEILTMANRASDLQVAIAQKGTAEKRARELTSQGMKEKATFDENIKQSRSKIKKLRENFNEVVKKVDNFAKDRLTELEIVHQNKNSERGSLVDQIGSLETEIQQCTREIQERETYQKELTRINSESVTIQDQINEWTYLRNAVSKDGLRALEIDSVAPAISAYANQILFNTFGSEYSVKLRTQDDEGREALDILALEEDGRETLLEDLSGGEQTWLLKALRLAMTLISKEKSGKAFCTAMADEEDGNLDAGNAQNFIHMYRAFIEAGGFDDCFFISHRPECVAMADHVLTFGNGGITIN
jgi:exonuclease SbcC